MSSYVQIVAVPQVSVKHSLKTSLVKSNVKALLVAELDKIGGDVVQMIQQHDPALIKYVCQLIENMIPQGNSKLSLSQKVDKFQLLIDTLCSKLQLSDDDKNKINLVVNFLISNGDVVAKPMKLFMKSLPSYFLACLKK